MVTLPIHNSADFVRVLFRICARPIFGALQTMRGFAWVIDFDLGPSSYNGELFRHS